MSVVVGDHAIIIRHMRQATYFFFIDLFGCLFSLYTLLDTKNFLFHQNLKIESIFHIGCILGIGCNLRIHHIILGLGWRGLLRFFRTTSYRIDWSLFQIYPMFFEVFFLIPFQPLINRLLLLQSAWTLIGLLIILRRFLLWYFFIFIEYSVINSDFFQHWFDLLGMV